MAVVYQSIETTAWALGTSTVVSKPSGVVDGDLMVAGIGISGNYGSITPPAGWTLINNTANTGTIGRLITYYKVASSEGSSYTWTTTNSVTQAGFIMRITGQKSAGFAVQVDGDSVANTAAPAFTGGITPLANGMLIFAFQAADTGGAVTPSNYAIATDNPTWTARATVSNGTNQTVLSVATADRPESSATGDYSITSGGGASTDSVGQLISIPVETDVTVNASPIVVTATLPSVTVSGDANTTVGLNSATFSILTPTVTTQTVDWTYESRPAESVWTIESQ